MPGTTTLKSGAGAPAEPSFRSEGLKRLALTAGSIVFFWALIELPALINLIDYQGLEYSQVWGSLRFIRVPDPELLHVEPPHAHYQGSSRGGDFETRFQVPVSDQTLFHWDLQYDQNGFRNSTDLKAADIVVIGDSMTEGMTVPEPLVVTSVLARLRKNIVANLGQYGYGPQQELAVLRRYGLALRPKVFIWMFYEGNDLSDEFEYRKLQLHPPGFWNFFLERSFTRFAFRAVRRFVAPAKPDGAIRSGIVRLPGASDANVYFSYPSQALRQDDLTAISDTSRIIASAQSLAASRQARFLFVFIPDKFRVLRDFCRFAATSECRNWALNDLPERMRSSVHSAAPGAEFLDITADLVQAARSGELPYYRDDIHFSEIGHRVAAEAINRYMASHGGE